MSLGTLRVAHRASPVVTRIVHAATREVHVARRAARVAHRIAAMVLRAAPVVPRIVRMATRTRRTTIPLAFWSKCRKTASTKRRFQLMPSAQYQTGAAAVPHSGQGTPDGSQLSTRIRGMASPPKDSPLPFIMLATVMSQCRAKAALNSSAARAPPLTVMCGEITTAARTLIRCIYRRAQGPYPDRATDPSTHHRA